MTVRAAAYAEDVLAGHPDRICDAVAERIVDHAVALDADALVGVEVGIHRRSVFVTGRVAAAGLRGEGDLPLRGPDGIVAAALGAAGYEGAWALDAQVVCDLDVGPLDGDERAIRRYSDDQNLVVGHACAAPGGVPVAVGTARATRRLLADLRGRHPGALGPDGKVLVGCDTVSGAVTLLNVSVQHCRGTGLPELYPLVAAEVAAPLGIDPALLVVNGAGDFTCGGPHGDNGLSGKKLVVDHYGPGVPIGGGALCGKDPHKVDRVGALRARQLALKLVGACAGSRAATVTLGWLPGREVPDVVAAEVDGRCVDVLAAVPADLRIAASSAAFDLAALEWAPLLRDGYFGDPRLPWER
ncbi:MAG: methionine adenosyltransferase domain-containing protein [Acidimicrobiia bacterium]